MIGGRGLALVSPAVRRGAGAREFFAHRARDVGCGERVAKNIAGNELDVRHGCGSNRPRRGFKRARTLFDGFRARLGYVEVLIFRSGAGAHGNANISTNSSNPLLVTGS